MTETPPVPTRRMLAKATLAALGIAAVLLVGAVLPAEYGIDPTGIGGALGLTAIHAKPPPPQASVDNATRELQVVRAEWSLKETFLGSYNGSLWGGEPQDDVTVPLKLDNLTRVRAVLTWVDDAPSAPQTDPDWLDFQILAPQGRSSQLLVGHNEKGQPGRIEADVVWSAARLPTQDGNGTRIPGGAPDASSHGNWRFRARMLTAGGPPGGGVDTGTAWRMDLYATTYAAHTFASSDPADRVRVTLEPHRAVEYKLRMNEGDSMHYAWTASAPLYVDFHGDQSTEESVVTHHDGISDRDEGDFTAPFTGRHGWYFQNSSAATITIDLETRGTYSIIGFL